MLIEEYFNLKKHPFLNTVDLEFLFWSEKFREGYARLLYSILESRTGLSLILGEIGCGKTMLCHALKKDMEDKGKRTSLIENPFLTPYQLLFEITKSFFGEKKRRRSKVRLYQEIEEELLKNPDEAKHVILIDEAHLLPQRTMQELRLLLNMETSEGKLLQIVLFGQTDLKKKLEKQKALKQRIGIAYNLSPLKEGETDEYIKHRLKVAGADKNLFTNNAIKRVYKFTKGIPRLINIICANSLFAAFSINKKKIDEKIVDMVVKDYKENLGEW